MPNPHGKCSVCATLLQSSSAGAYAVEEEQDDGLERGEQIERRISRPGHAGGEQVEETDVGEDLRRQRAFQFAGGSAETFRQCAPRGIVLARLAVSRLAQAVEPRLEI